MFVSKREAEINKAAEFTGVSSDVNVPSIEVGGVLVVVYVKQGRLHISVETDEADPAICYPDNPDLTSMLVSINGDRVFDSDAQ